MTDKETRVRRGRYVGAIGFVVSNPSTRAALADACIALADAENAAYEWALAGKDSTIAHLTTDLAEARAMITTDDTELRDKDATIGRLTRGRPLESWEITPTCRANRGHDGAWQEAVDQLRQVYDAQVARFGPTATLTLSLARSRAVGATQAAYNACYGVSLRRKP
jgi:hypothetical protein